MTFIQVGMSSDLHRPLKGENVLNCIGEMSRHRSLYKLVYHSIGTINPITYLHHIAAAFDKPSWSILGGRENPTWINMYAKAQIFHSIGMLDCCKHGGCWKARVVPLKDGGDDTSLCHYPCIANGFD